MESETKQTYPCINGLSKPPSEGQMVEKKKANFLLLKDPFLDDKVQKKIYRYDGLLPGGQSIDLKDPRRRSNQRSNPRYRLWSSRQVMDLDVPRFKYDQNYIGTPPPNEVTFTNLNDNIDSKFLGNMCRQFGSIEEIKIYHHPKTKKHMGIGKVLFTSSKCAKACVDKLHQTSKMGNIINAMIDTMGKERSRIIEEMLADKPKNARRPIPPPERVDPRSHGRLYAAASTSSNRSVVPCNFTTNKSKYNDYGLEAYDPGDTEFDFGNVSGHRQLVNTSLENTSYSDSDYGSLQHCDSGYSVPQSEMSFSGHSDMSSSSYDSYGQYSSQHVTGNRGWSCTPHAAPYSYGVQQQYGQHGQHNSGRQMNASYSQQQQQQQQQQQHYSHSNYDATHQTCPPPEPTAHSHIESTSRSHSYSERREEYKDRSTSSFSHHHWEKEREREVNNREKCREKEHRIRPKTPEPEEPRNQSLESRLQSIFGLGGLGSPTESNRSKDHSSPSSTPRSRDEVCTPSPGVDSRYSSQQYPVSSRASSSGTCSSHVLQMPPLPPDIEEETKLLPNPTSKSDSSDRPDYSREPSSRTKRFEFKNSLEHSNSISHYDQLKTEKVASAVASSSSSSVSTTSRYRPESNDDNCSNGLLGAASGDFTNVSQQAKNFTAAVTPSLPKHIPVEEKSEEKENNVDMEIDNDDDDDDRMSLSSISSGEEKLEVNVQLPSSDGKFTTNNFHSMGSSQASRTAPPVPLITDFSRPPPGMQPWSYYSFGNYSAAPARMDLTTGTFNQSYCSQIPGSLMPINYAGQALADSSLPQTASTTGRSENRQQEEEPEEKDPNDKTFLFVLDHFVRELKEVMQKDLCKKMVENSAFKSFELWWDTEEQKSKFQKGSGPNEKAPINKDTSLKTNKSTINTQQSGTQLTSGGSDVNSTLASLFETQHPWRQEGGFEAHYGGAHGGGFLGIRGVMPRMPSFKKKVFRPPSPPPPDDEDSKAAESFASNAEDESDDDVVGSSPSTRKKNVYASDEESASEDEKSDATASDDEEEASDESSEDESDEEASDETSETSEEGSEEEEEEEEESEAKAKNENVFTSETKAFSISSESEKMSSTNDTEVQSSVEESDLKAETRKIQDDSLKESSSESESEIDDSEKDTTESSSDAEPDQTVLFKPQLSPIKEEEEQDEMNREDKGYINEKASVSTEHEVQERPELSGAMRLSARTDNGMLVDTNSATCTPESNLYTDISSNDQAFVSTESKKTLESSAQVSATVDDSDENKEITATTAATTTTTSSSSSSTTTTTNSTLDEEVPSTEISSEVTATSDEEASTDHSKGYMIPAIAEHDYVAMPPPLPQGIEMKSSEDSDHIEDEEAEEEEEDSDRTESCDEDNTPLEILMDHNYCLPPAIGEVHEDSEMSAGWSESKVMSDDSLKSAALLGNSAANAAVQDVVQKLSTGNLTVDEHAAAATAAVVAAAAATVSASRAAADDIKSTKKKKKRVKDSTLTDITNKSVNEHEAETVKPIVKPKIQFQPRGYQEDKQLFFDIYNKGIDQEDINYLKRTYETLLQSEDPMYDWLNDIFWVDHTHTDIPDPVPPKKKRKVDEQITPVHKTGSARTEGFYKISKREKAGYLCHANKAAETGQQNDKKLSMTSREARHNIRRFQTNFGDLELGELFKFNQLKFRKKQLRFAKSSIHDWGLFALEPIAAEEMVIEYVGQVIRHFVADEREKQYGAQGIGSSYLFRVDNETIIDATKAGNLARFINHSCNPNCYAKIITVEAHKKIVIYSKRDIDVNEEITYDYKFPLEEEKISCLCGAQGCKGTLN